MLLLRCLWAIALITVGHCSMALASESGVSPMVVEEYFQSRGKTVLTFVGYSDSGYEDHEAMLEKARTILESHSVENTIINIGATVGGIGAVYKVAKDLGFETTGIVSIQAKHESVNTSPHVDKVFFVEDESWGGFQEDKKTLSPTSQAMVQCSDLLIAIGGGGTGRDELIAAKRQGKKVRYFAADKNHKLATEKAAKKGQPAPTDFRGAAFAVFGDKK